MNDRPTHPTLVFVQQRADEALRALARAQRWPVHAAPPRIATTRMLLGHEPAAVVLQLGSRREADAVANLASEVRRLCRVARLSVWAVSHSSAAERRMRSVGVHLYLAGRGALGALAAHATPTGSVSVAADLPPPTRRRHVAPSIPIPQPPHQATHGRRNRASARRKETP